MEMSIKTSDRDSGLGDDNISEIIQFYDGCNILLTGGSGFVGKLLIDKILRSCSNIQKLYLILREKKGKSPIERYKGIFEDPLYDRLKREQPNFQNKIVMIEGGFDNNGLTMSTENCELIKDSHIVFHGAATVRFDDKLRFAVNINVRGTKEILQLCKQMPNLKAVVHIGTAFSQCVNKFIDEVFYEPPIDCDKILTLLDTFNDEQLEAITPTLLGKWPNTYAFTKSIAENVVLKYSKELPICIVRPSIMIATEKDPLAGWIDNIYGPTGVAVAVGLGLMHSLHCHYDNIADIIPADYVINNIIASAWDTGTLREKSKSMVTTLQSNGGGDVKENSPIYNSVTSIQNPVTWGQYLSYNKVYGLNVPSMLAVWYYFFTLNKYIWLHTIYVFLFDIIPAVTVDTIARLAGRRATFLTTYRKIHKFSGVISYFSMQQWTFRNNNVLKLWNKMSPIDRKIFYFHVGEFTWDQYFYYHVRGLRAYLIKDPLSTVPQATKRYFKLKMLHYSLITIFWLLFLWMIFVVIKPLYSISI